MALKYPLQSLITPLLKNQPCEPFSRNQEYQGMILLKLTTPNLSTLKLVMKAKRIPDGVCARHGTRKMGRW